MRKNNKKISKRSKIIDYIIITIIVLILAFVTYRFKNYFGSDSDWVNQHTVFPDYFRTIFYKTGNLLPNISFHIGAGQNIFNFAYYGLLNPLYLFSYFFPFLKMVTYIQIINILIMITSGILFYNLLEKHGHDRSMCLSVSIMFLLGTPFLFHLQRHIMFVNYMPFLIMGFHGIDKYLDKHKKLLLIISVFLMITSSYYYSVCGLIVLCIYYLHEYLNKQKKIIVKKLIVDILKFGLVLSVGVMLSGILLLPTIYTIFAGRNYSESAITLKELLIPQFKIYNLFSDKYAIGLYTFGFVTLLYLFFTKKRNNIIIATIISILFFIPIFKYYLNGGLYIRDKCFIPFLPLFCYYISFMLKDIFSKKINYLYFSIFLLLIFCPLFFWNRILRFYGVLGLFIISLFAYKKFDKKIIVYGFMILTLLSKAMYDYSNEIRLSFKDYNEFFPSYVENTIDNMNELDGTYYRTSNLYHQKKSVNKVYNENYYTNSIFSSTYNGGYLDFNKNHFYTNFANNNNFIIYANSNLLYNSFMGVKYLYTLDNPGLGYQEVDINLYKNNYVLPIVYARSNVMSINDYYNYNYPNNVELLLNNVVVDGESINTIIDFNSEKVLLNYDITNIEGVEVKEENGIYDLIVKDTGYIDIIINNDIENKLLLLNILGLEGNKCDEPSISMSINGNENVLPCRESYYYTKNETFHYVLSDNKELKIKLLEGRYHIDSIEGYLVDYQNVINYNYDELLINKMSDDEIIGDIVVKEDGYLVTSIPYDEGFKIYIDDKLVDKEKVNIAFLGSKIEKGIHHIKITYHSPWLNYGYIVSGLGIITLIGIIIFDRKKKVK